MFKVAFLFFFFFDHSEIYLADIATLFKTLGFIAIASTYNASIFVLLLKAFAQKPIHF